MLFFLFRKSYIFWFFLFSKKFIISYEKVKKQTIYILKTNYFQQKAKKKNKCHQSLFLILYTEEDHPLQLKAT